MSSFNINGRTVSLPADPRTTLLDFLHQQLQMFGTKKGCDHGQCGACTVLINGERVNACLLLAYQCEGAEITTIEGVSEDDELSPLQQAFIEHDAFQCGYCTPGQLCSATALMEELNRQDPSIVSGKQVTISKDEIRERMSGNLCRCGAYPNIVDAIYSVLSDKGNADETI